MTSTSEYNLKALGSHCRVSQLRCRDLVRIYAAASELYASLLQPSFSFRVHDLLAATLMRHVKPSDWYFTKCQITMQNFISLKAVGLLNWHFS